MPHSVIIPYRYPDPIEYREIPGYHDYLVGNDGSVWTRKKAGGQGSVCDEYRRLSPGVDKIGRVFVSLSASGKVKRFPVHHLVLIAFVRARPDGLDCCHFPVCDPSNNCVTNLRWDTKKNNEIDKVLAGTATRGEKNHNSARTSEEIMDIRRRFSEGETQESIGAKYGIPRTNVSEIVRGIRWKHLPLIPRKPKENANDEDGIHQQVEV